MFCMTLNKIYNFENLFEKLIKKNSIDVKIPNVNI